MGVGPHALAGGGAPASKKRNADDRSDQLVAYFISATVTSIFMTSPDTGSVADVYCVVWPSRSSAVNEELKLRNDGRSGATRPSPPFGVSRPTEESETVSASWKMPGLDSSN